MKKIRIVQFIPALTTGGAENLVKQYSLMLDKELFQLKVICLHNANSFLDLELKNDSIDIVYIDDIIDEMFRFLPTIGKKVMHRFFRLVIFKREIKKFKPDVVHYHLLLSGYIKYARLEKSTKIILTVHSEPKKLWNDSRNRRNDFRDTKWLLENYSMKLVALHSEMKEQLMEMFNTNNVCIINNGIQMERFINLPPKDVLKERHSLPNDALIIGHVGRFVQVKNHFFLLEIFSQLLQMWPKAILLLVGEGAEKKKIEARANELGIDEKVRFLGTRSDVPEIMKLMDVLIFPSIYEGFSITLIEAQVIGLKCIVSDTIKKEHAISNLIEFKSLNDSAQKWAEATVEFVSKQIELTGEFEKWDMKNIILELQKLYSC